MIQPGNVLQTTTSPSQTLKSRRCRATFNAERLGNVIASPDRHIPNIHDLSVNSTQIPGLIPGVNPINKAPPTANVAPPANKKAP